MEFQNSQQTQRTVLDPQTLEQLTTEIQQEMREILDNSNLRKILEKYGLLLEFRLGNKKRLSNAELKRNRLQR